MDSTTPGMHQTTGSATAQYVAAAAVELINRGDGKNSRLPAWWRAQP
jgi:hypothetical protein